jgi:hypothetical protein
LALYTEGASHFAKQPEVNKPFSDHIKLLQVAAQLPEFPISDSKKKRKIGKRNPWQPKDMSFVRSAIVVYAMAEVAKRN